MKNPKFILALLAGAAVGAALGLVFAPDRGIAMKKKLKEGAEDLKSKFSKKANAKIEELEHEIQKLKRAARHNGKTTVEKIREMI